MSDPQVIVVGAGPAGLVLALVLSRSGIRVTVLAGRDVRARVPWRTASDGCEQNIRRFGLRERILALGYVFPTDDRPRPRRPG